MEEHDSDKQTNGKRGDERNCVKLGHCEAGRPLCQ